MTDLPEAPVSRSLPFEEVLRYAAALAESLRRLHRNGMVYGRLDPRNIHWDNQCARLAEDGTPADAAYQSPEQVRGETCDARSDIFAFGAIVYELLTGSRSFPAEDAGELKRQILECSPPPIEGIPEGVGALLKGCLEKSPGLRWQRMNPILIELKLANAAARQAQAAADWRDNVLTLREHVAAHNDRLQAQHDFQDALASELRQAVGRLEGAQAALQESIARLQREAQIHGRSIEGLQVAATQTDEVVEHVVEAFGMMHKSLAGHGDAKVLLGARNGN